MKSTLLILLVSTLLFACGNEKKQETEAITETEVSSEEEKLPILLGKQEITAIKSAPYSSWFMENYKYSPNQKVLGSLKEALEGKKITIFMGTWCSDSQLQVPALLSVLDAIKYDNSNITLITMSEDKDTPENLEEGLNIQYVPTIILYDGESEMGRIVEYPVESLEADLLAIATGKEYKHSYADE
ncbi:MAG: thioredoxin family protein [Flavobacteriaceae bacterium]|nr:thioredoxin family protein [Flavobacteriaceae bacterium]